MSDNREDAAQALIIPGRTAAMLASIGEEEPEHFCDLDKLANEIVQKFVNGTGEFTAQDIIVGDIAEFVRNYGKDKT